MRVYVEKQIEGESCYTLVPGRRRQLAPVQVRGKNKETVRGAFLVAYNKILGRDGPPTDPE